MEQMKRGLMKKHFKKLMLYSAYRKTLGLYVTAIIIVGFGILIGSFVSVTNRMKLKNMDTSKQLLQQLVTTTERVQEDMENLLSVIASDTKISSVTHRGGYNRWENYLLFLKLSEWKGFFSYVENVSVLNLDTRVCVQAAGKLSTREETLAAAENMIENQLGTMNRDIQILERDKRVVSFMYFFPYQNSAIVIDVNSDLFQYSISEQAESTRIAYILDDDGQMVNNIAGDKEENSLVTEYLTGVIAQNEISTSPMVYKDAENRQFVFICRSKGTGWYLCDIQKYEVFYQDLAAVSVSFLIMILVFAGVVGVTSVLFIKKIQTPLMKAVERARGTTSSEASYVENELLYLDSAITRISTENNIHKNYINAQYLKNTMLGYGMPFLLPREKLQKLKETYEAPYYAVMLVKIQAEAIVEVENQREENSLYRFMVCNLADEIFGEKYRCKATDLREDTVGILLLLEEAELSDEYQECFQKMKIFAKEKLGILLTGSVGHVVSNQEEIFESCQKAEQFGKVSNIIGKKELIDSNQIENTNYQEKNQKLVESILEYTQMNYTDPELSLKSISQIFHLSTSYIGKIFKAIQGTSYSSYLATYRLEESRILLLETTKSINEIAASLGFTNATYFTTIFKNQYGLTPTAFRNERNLAQIPGQR